MTTKTIKLDKPYLKNIYNLEKEKKYAKDIITNVYERWMNESNYNHLQYALEALEEYRYVAPKYVIPNGRYIRYIDLKDPYDAKLRLGGFVIYDNGYSVTFMNRGKFIKINKKRAKAIFVRISDDELLRSQFEKF
tara:strand:+ start:1524 stop:1928 length:405 start_codon:yes stop_codon:yes gene_type:complete